MMGSLCAQRQDYGSVFHHHTDSQMTTKSIQRMDRWLFQNRVTPMPTTVSLWFQSKKIQPIRRLLCRDKLSFAAHTTGCIREGDSFRIPFESKELDALIPGKCQYHLILYWKAGIEHFPDIEANQELFIEYD
jgi:hypothetical protein